MKKIILLGALLTIGAYTLGRTIWADKGQLTELISPTDYANGAIFPVQELYNYLVDKAALKKVEEANITFEQRQAIPDMTQSPNKQFRIGLRIGVTIPLEDWVNKKTYRLMMPSAFGDVMNIDFTPDNQMIILSLMQLPTSFVCGFSTHFNEEYDQAMGNKLFLPPLFQVRLVGIISAWVANNQLVAWAGEQGEQYYYSHPTPKLYYYSLATLHELRQLFTDASIINLLQALEKARKTNNSLSMDPEQLKMFNAFSSDIKQALKPFISPQPQ